MRQRLKQVERCKEESALVENFKKVAEKHAVKKFNTKKALQAYKVVEVEATKEAIDIQNTVGIKNDWCGT